MKRTSYIIFGVLLGGLLVMGGTILYMAAHGQNIDDSRLSFTGVQKTVQLPECKVLKLVAPNEVLNIHDGIQEIRQVSFGDLPLEMHPADSLAGNFSFASDLEPFVTMKSTGDTLTIAFAFPKEKLDKKLADRRWLAVAADKSMILALPSGVQSVISDMHDLVTTVKGFERDSLSLTIHSKTVVENSHFRSLCVQKGNWTFNSGSVDNLHLHLDGINNWQVNTDSFHIDTEYLSGSRKLNCTLQKNECRQMLWTPMTKEASLDVKLQTAAKVELQ